MAFKTVVEYLLRARESSKTVPICGLYDSSHKDVACIWDVRYKFDYRQSGEVAYRYAE
ncbi:protein of unknown function [Pararobbsia alpina]